MNKNALETFVLSEKYMLCECNKLYLIILFISLYVFNVQLLEMQMLTQIIQYISDKASFHYYLHNHSYMFFSSSKVITTDDSALLNLWSDAKKNHAVKIHECTKSVTT